MVTGRIDDVGSGKLMLRVYSGEQKGATAFFRNRPLLQTLTGLLAERSQTPGERLRVLFHASSVGAEVYSFAVWFRIHELHKKYDLEIRATDINPEFVSLARSAQYPQELLQTMTEREAAFFQVLPGNRIAPVEEVRKMVTFLDPSSFMDPVADEYEVVAVLNALTYVSEAEQALAIARISSYNTRYLAITAFHPDTIESDLRHNGYRPVEDNIEEIHSGWNERIVAGKPTVRGTPEHSWVLPPFSRIEGYEYRFCAIFEKDSRALNDPLPIALL